MKNAIVTLAFLFGATALAQAPGEGSKSPTPPPAAAAHGKTDKKVARAECSKEGKKGADLKKCIKDKLTQ